MTEKQGRFNLFIKGAVWGAVVAACLWTLPAAYSAADRTYEQLKILVDVLQYIKENYVEEVETQKLIYGAATGMVKTLDPFSQFMEPEVHKEIKTETEGQFGGLGIRIQLKDGWLTVVTPLPGTPAYRAGILPLDRIIKIEGETTREVSLDDALKKLRGNPGTKVTITIAREPSDPKAGSWSTQDVTITREIIKLESVKAKMLPDKIGYLSIADFNAHTSEDVLRELRRLKKEGMEAFVLDLRNNPGGLLSSAVEVSRYFVGEGKMIVYTKARQANSGQEFRAGAAAPFADLPMVVLVNKGSASGSEIVAGALQDHKRAVVIGSRTFGKASVQSVIPLADGSGLRLTVAKYYTPNGRLIHSDNHGKEGGIPPDIEVPVPDEVMVKLQRQSEEVFEPGKETRSTVKQEERVKDEVLERATELLKARDVLGRLSGSKQG